MRTLQTFKLRMHTHAHTHTHTHTHEHTQWVSNSIRSLSTSARREICVVQEEGIMNRFDPYARKNHPLLLHGRNIGLCVTFLRYTRLEF